MKAAFALFLATIVALVAGILAVTVAGWQPLALPMLALTSSVWLVVYVLLLVLIARAASETEGGAA